jgi:hypothetical protein
MAQAFLQIELQGRAVFTAGMLAAAGLALGACASVEKKLPFDSKVHTAALAKGTAKIEGEGFLRRRNAWIARCSGEVVYLVPDTPYFREWVEIYRSGNTIENASALNEKHRGAIRKTQCNMQGKFTFANLPAGKWLVATRVTYDSEATISILPMYDYTFLTEVETKAGETTPVILSNPNRI